MNIKKISSSSSSSSVQTKILFLVHHSNFKQIPFGQSGIAFIFFDSIQTERERAI